MSPQGAVRLRANLVRTWRRAAAEAPRAAGLKPAQARPSHNIYLGDGNNTIWAGTAASLSTWFVGNAVPFNIQWPPPPVFIWIEQVPELAMPAVVECED
jgi:hypothetical protein